jgi:protein O-mannosyl-transferase
MSAPDPPRGPPRPTTAAVALALGIATLALYARVAGHAFLFFDDDLYVHANERVRAGLSWAGVAWAFTTLDVSNWQPLTWLSHMLDVELFGVTPAGPHLVNAALHAANAALLFAVLRALTGAPGRSAAVALLFAVHPLHVESVAWIAERKDVLSTAFGLLALAAYARYAARPAPRRLVPVAAAFALSLMAKAMWVTLPFLLLLLDFWPLQRVAGSPAERDPGPPPRPPVSLRRAVLEKVPLLLMSAAASAVTFVAQRRSGMIAPLDFGPGQRAANAAVSYALYLARTVWPSGLAVHYPLRRTLPAWEVAAAAALLAALTAGALWLARRRPFVLVGWLWFLGMLVPVAGLVQLGGQAMADRYTYVPLAGVFVAAVWGGALLLPRRAALAVAAAAVAALSAATWVQLGHWRDDETLFRRALAVTEDNGLAHYNLGTRLAVAGRLDEARPLLARAAQLEPGNGGAWNALGNFAQLDGDLAGAADLYRRAGAVSPRLLEARYNLATTLARLGRCEEARREAAALHVGGPEEAKLRGRVAAAGDPLAEALRQACP